MHKTLYFRYRDIFDPDIWRQGIFANVGCIVIGDDAIDFDQHFPTGSTDRHFDDVKDIRIETIPTVGLP